MCDEQRALTLIKHVRFFSINITVHDKKVFSAKCSMYLQHICNDSSSNVYCSETRRHIIMSFRSSEFRY